MDKGDMSDKFSDEKVHCLKNEIKMAEKYNHEELEPHMIEAIQRYTGKHCPRYGTNWDIVLNEVYPIIQNNLPSIFFQNPRAFLKPRNKTYITKQRDPKSEQWKSVEMDSSKSARTQESILNYQVYRMNYKREARKVLMDALLFPHGILWHGYKGNYGMTAEASMQIRKDEVFVKRINPMRFVFDPAVTMSNLDEARWIGRKIDVRLDDLLEDDDLDVDRKQIKGFLAYGDKVGSASQRNYTANGGQDALVLNKFMRSLIDFTDERYKNSNAARFVTLYEVFHRPTPKEEAAGAKGSIVLITFEQLKPLRVNDWLIKADGFPSMPLVFNDLPDNKFGLADIETYKDIIDQKNCVINLQLRNAQENSKVWVAIAKGGTSEEDIERIEKGNQTIVLFDGDTVTGKMTVASASGAASNELYMLDQRIDKNLQDKSGVTDLKKGFLQSGEESAASVQLRAAGGSSRPAYRQDLMAEFLKNSFIYINHLLKQFMPFDDAVRIIGSLDLQWSENPSKEELGADVDVEIDVTSMLPENPEKETQELNTVLNLIVEALTQPAIMQKLQQENKVMNLAPVIEQLLIRLKIRDPNIFRDIKPEESQGFASVEQLREAKDNVVAAVTGQQIPHPPAETDDHMAKMEIYSTVQQLIQLAGKQSQQLDQLMMAQQALMEQAQEKQANPGQTIKRVKPFSEALT